MVSAPRGMSEWAAKGTGGQADKGTRKTGGLGGEEGTRAQTTQPLSYIPCPVGSQGKHIQCVLGWETAFLKNSFL